MDFLSQIKQPIEAELSEFIELFNQSLSHDEGLLSQALQHIRQRGGKRMRPILTLLMAKHLGGVNMVTQLAAVGLELLHTASLVHDDVVDESSERRGQASVNASFNNKVAVLVGDYILSTALYYVAKSGHTPIITSLAQLGQTLSSGELLQLHANQSMWISEEQYFRIITQKTAYLFAACAEAGAESSAATMRQTTALREFGKHLGICFQLKDDIFDYSDAEEIGKPTMSDIRDGKCTLPLLISLVRAPKAEADQIKQLAEDLYQDITDPVNAEQEIKSFVLRYDGVRYTAARMAEHKKSAVQALSVFRDSPAKSSLLALLDYAVNRDH